MHKVGIIGASGYTGYELIKILSRHKKVKLVVLNSKSYAGKKVNELYPDFGKNIKFTNYPISEINEMGIDIMFLAVPHTTAMELVPKLNCRIVDLSADYRFKDISQYEKIYGVKHKDKKTKAVYGLPELFKEQIKKARLVANPGCYATGMILSAYPIQKLAKYIVYDCKSGWSGAGRSSAYAKNPAIIRHNIIAYKLTTHRHKYEVEQFINLGIGFTPHVIDAFEGMMITAHILLKKEHNTNKIKKIYKEFYKECPFVEISDTIADMRAAQGTNKCIIGGFEADENNRLVVVSALDNLIKGASGQAVQNMNIMLDFNEEEGLKWQKK
jgi:N-acetyl-gamma-glutamyl-phosphate reductase